MYCNDGTDHLMSFFSTLIIQAFNAELERVLNAQQEYCLSDAKLAEEIKSEIRSLVCEPYAAMYAR